jgi:organic hydroperoxide reductase OsmC/OhrA
MTILEPDRVDAALAIHEKAHRLCFIARSVNFGVRHEPLITVAV